MQLVVWYCGWVWAVAEKDTLSNRDALVNGTVLITYITLLASPLSLQLSSLAVTGDSIKDIILSNK